MESIPVPTNVAEVEQVSLAKSRPSSSVGGGVSAKSTHTDITILDLDPCEEFDADGE